MLVILLFLCGLILSLYIFFIEPFQLVTKQLPVYIEETQTSLSEPSHVSPAFTILQISDTHFSRFYGRKKFQKVIDTVNRLKPDLLLFTGDLIDDYRYWQKHDSALLIELLKAIDAPEGKYAVLGNHDYEFHGEQTVKDILSSSGFILLENEQADLLLGGHRILLTGIDDARGGQPDYSLTAKTDAVNILMVHEPDQVLELTSDTPFQLILAGHSHGGQLHFPFFRKKNAGSKRYVLGTYQLKNHSILNVNTGLGTTGIPARLRVPPEITFYHIYLPEN